MIKRNSVLLILFIFSSFLYSQKEKSDKHVITYTNSNNIEFLFNREKGYSNEPIIPNKGFELEINSFHGFYFLKSLSLSAGIGLAYHVSENILAIPIVGEIKFHLNPYYYDGPFVSLNAGRNLKVGNFKSGGSAKLGIGYLFYDDTDFMYVISIFAKSKEYTLDNSTNFNLQTLSLGISAGIQF